MNFVSRVSMRAIPDTRTNVPSLNAIHSFKTILSFKTIALSCGLVLSVSLCLATYGLDLKRWRFSNGGPSRRLPQQQLQHPSKRHLEHLRLSGGVMPKRWMMLICILLLGGSAGPSEANPLDSPDTVYIDGLPCSTAFFAQSIYMAWSRAASSRSPRNPHPRKLQKAFDERCGPRATALRGKFEAGGNARSGSKTEPHQIPTRCAGSKECQICLRVTPLPFPILRDRTFAGSPAKADVATNPNPRTIQEQVAAATAVAELVTVARPIPASEQKPNFRRSALFDAWRITMLSDDTASASPKNAHLLVALLADARKSRRYPISPVKTLQWMTCCP